MKDEELSYDEYLQKIITETSKGYGFEDTIHPEVNKIMSKSPKLRESLLEPYNIYEELAGEADAWREKVWTQKQKPSPEIEYAYLKHQELALERLISKTLPKQLALRNEFLRTGVLQAENAVTTQEQQLRQLEQHRAAMEASQQQQLDLLHDRWRETLNENLKSTL